MLHLLKRVAQVSHLVVRRNHGQLHIKRTASQLLRRFCQLLKGLQLSSDDEVEHCRYCHQQHQQDANHIVEQQVGLPHDAVFRNPEAYLPQYTVYLALQEITLEDGVLSADILSVTTHHARGGKVVGLGTFHNLAHPLKVYIGTQHGINLVIRVVQRHAIGHQRTIR